MHIQYSLCYSLYTKYKSCRWSAKCTVWQLSDICKAVVCVRQWIGRLNTVQKEQQAHKS